MPFDGRGFEAPKTVEITKESFLAWARSKPRFGTYDYYEGRNCAITQYLREEHNLEFVLVSSHDFGGWIDGRYIEGHVPAWANYAASVNDCADLTNSKLRRFFNGQTFGALAKRIARA